MPCLIATQRETRKYAVPAGQLGEIVGAACAALGITVDEVDEKSGLRRATQVVQSGGQSARRAWEFRVRPLGEGQEGVALQVMLQDLLALDGGTVVQGAVAEFFAKLEETIRAHGLSTDPPPEAPRAADQPKLSPLVWVGAAFAVLAILVGLSFAGVFSPKPHPAEIAALTPGHQPASTDTVPEEKPMTDLSTAKGSAVKIQTAQGDIVIETFDKEAPLTAGNFLDLVKSGSYNGLTFHRAEAGFVIQGGDPNGNGSGGPGWTIPLEAKATALTHERGSLSMARTSAPDSAGSQFFIVLGAQAAGHLNGQYAVFGKVLKGMDVVDKIAQDMLAQKARGIAPHVTMTKVTIEKESPDAAAALAATKKARIKGGG